MDAELPGLRWGVKTSFVRYVAALPDGRVSVGRGATPLAGDIALFPPREPAPEPQESEAFEGEVRFSGHGGLLLVQVAHPSVVIDGASAIVTVADTTEDGTATRLPIARCTLSVPQHSAGLTVRHGTDVRLLASGVAMFNHVYTEGELFDDLTIYAHATR